MNIAEIEIIEKDQNEMLCCNLCDRSFRRINNLRSHVKTHANLRPFKCEICDSRFSRHSKTHSQLKPHTCSSCGRSFARKDALIRHERINTSGKEKHCVDHDEIVGTSYSPTSQPKYPEHPRGIEGLLSIGIPRMGDRLAIMTHDLAKEFIS